MSKRRPGRARGADGGSQARPAARMERKAVIVEEPNERAIGEHIRMAHATFKGEHQIEECVRILTVAPEGLPLLATLRDECRVGADERRSFEEVIRTWTEFVLSGVE